MIKFSGVREGREFIGIGLSRANCEKLLAGKPIQVDLSALGVFNADELLIMGGETEKSMTDDLTELGIFKGVLIRMDGTEGIN